MSEFWSKIKTDEGEETIPLFTIHKNSTEYEYGKALAGALRPYVEKRIKAEVEVYGIHGSTPSTCIHKLLIVPKGSSIMVTDNGAGTMPLQSAFRSSAKLLPERYLVMVNPEANNNKFYRMMDLGNGKWGAYYGRIGASQGESVYSGHVTKPYIYQHYMYEIKYQEKLAKGYKDVTEYHTSTEQSGNINGITKTFEKIDDKAVADLVQRLMDYANYTISENYTVDVADVTPAMITAAKEELNKLYKLGEGSDVSAFNDCLLNLMHIIPRRIDGARENGVKRMMSKGQSDFSRIISREEDLLDVMAGQVKIHTEKENMGEETKSKTILDAMGIEIYTAHPEQRAQVEQHLSGSLKPKLKAVYRVINKKSQRRFSEYLQEHGGKRKVKVKQFWHGSRNENWISILQNSLLLKPNAIITGKMFGNGIYFAPSAAKSWGYTSARGTRWARGTSNTAFMALFATAYGNPYEVFSFSGNWNGYEYNRLVQEHPGCNCVHAKKDLGMLHEDEVIFYREDQMTINYICEFAV